MEIFFMSHDLWDIVDTVYQEPPESGSWTQAQEKQYKENRKKDATALRYLQQGVSKSIYPRISGAKKAKVAWDILKEEFQGSEKAITLRLQSLWRDFDNLSMRESETIRDFSSRVAEIVNQIKGCGDTIEDKKVIEKVLRSLPPKFDHVVAAIEESKDLSAMSMYQLTGSLLAHEQRINKSSHQPVEQAFQSKLSFSEKKSSRYDDDRRPQSSFQRRNQKR